MSELIHIPEKKNHFYPNRHIKQKELILMTSLLPCIYISLAN